MVEEASDRRSSELTTPEQRKATTLDGIIARVAIRLELSREEIRGGSRRRTVAAGRYPVGYMAVRKYGHPVTEVARALKVSSQSVSQTVEKEPSPLKDLG